MNPRVAVLALLLLPLLSSSAAARPTVELDLQDPAEDVIVDPRSGASFSGARPTVDIVRVQQRAEGDAIVIVVTVGGPVAGEAGATMEVLASVKPQGLGEQVIFGVRWDAQGNVTPPQPAMAVINGQSRSVNVTAVHAGSDVTLRLEGVPSDTPCFTAHTIAFGVKTRDVEYTDWYYPSVSTCDTNDRFDGAQDSCPPVAAKTEFVAVALQDASGDVEERDPYGKSQAVSVAAGLYDITSAESGREGDRIVQTVTLAEPRNASRELRVDVIARLSGGQDRDQEPTHAIVARYWRFANATVADRVEGILITPGEGQDKVNFPVRFEAAGSTLTLSWCASLLPEQPACFGLEVEAASNQVFVKRTADEARAAVDPCLAAPRHGRTTTTSTTTPPTSGDDGALDEDAPSDEEGADDGTGTKESPGLDVALVVAAAALALFARRR